MMDDILRDSIYQSWQTESQKRIAALEAQVSALTADRARLVRFIWDIRNLSEVGNVFDGHDECNEITHDINEQLLTSTLDRINEDVRALLAELAEDEAK
jgi:hypothetical protein